MGNNEITCISLCSGYEGIGLGLKRVLPNLRTIAYAEIEEYACAVLAARMGEGKLDVAPIWTDVKTFPGEDFYGKVHILTSGYPCQPFSVAGKRKGTDDPRHLWPHIARIVKAVRPVWCFFENVPGHLSMGFPEVYRSLRDMGYKVEAGLFTAAEVGAPHKRQRLFVLAKSGECNGEWGAARSGRWIGQPDQIGESGRIGQLGNTTTIRPCGISEDTGETGPDEEREERRLYESLGASPLSEYDAQQKWPARPGQQQYEWEEPRVVADTKQRNKRAVSLDIGQGKGESDQHRGAATSRSETEGQAESGVGRATSRCACGMDRLRLLGNGCIPAQVERAVRLLWAKHDTNEKK